MMKNIHRSDTSARMSQLVVHDGRVYLAGQVADDTDTDVAAQTQQVLNKIEALLAKAGCDKTMMLSAMIWLSDIASYDAFNSVWDSWLPQGCAPVRACVEARLAGAQYLVEVSIVAAQSVS